MLLGLIAANAGEISLLGAPMPSAAGRVLPLVGALIEGPAFHPYLTRRAQPAPARRQRRHRRPAHLAASASRDALARVGLGAAAGKKYRHYSLGMKQRLGLAAALLQPRDLLILDEPTNGLDPQGTREIRRLVRELASDGTTVLVSSHLLAEIEQVATHVGIMAGGRLVRQGPLAEVLADGVATLRVTTPDLDRAATVLVRPRSAHPTREPDAEALTARLGERAVEDVAHALVTAGVRVRGLTAERRRSRTCSSRSRVRASMSSAELAAPSTGLRRCTATAGRSCASTAPRCGCC